MVAQGQGSIRVQYQGKINIKKREKSSSLKHERPSYSVPFNVSVMKEGVEEWEEGVTQQQGLFHGRTGRRAESGRILRLKSNKTLFIYLSLLQKINTLGKK